jgi:hypothetical protein
MPKITLAQLNQLLAQRSGGKISFFESMRYNYGSYSAAGKALGIPGRTLQELSEAPRGYEKRISDVRAKQVQKAISKMSRGNYQAATRFVYAQGREGMTPGQLAFAEKYSKTQTGQKYFRKTINDFYEKKTKRVLMPALTSNGKIVNSPRTKKVARGGRRRAIRRPRR